MDGRHRAIANGNITRVIPIDITSDAFTDENGFFIRAESAGYIKYCPFGNEDSEYIIKYFDSSYIFIDPEVCRKVFPSTELITSPECNEAGNIYIGYGV